jgi:hypothetical protein
MAHIKITWIDCGYLAFRGDDYDPEYRNKYLTHLASEGYPVKPDASTEFDFDFGGGAFDEDIAEQVFMATNRYSGELWSIIEPLLPAQRGHTALSIGDLVEVDGVAYRCEPVGFQAIN